MRELQHRLLTVHVRASDLWYKAVQGSMVLTLGSNISSLKSQHVLGNTAKKLSSVFERLSSGQRINRASDDAAGLAIADGLRSDARVYNQGVRNLNDGVSLLKVADGAISQLSTITARLVELAEQSANGAFSNTQRNALDEEGQSLKAEYFRIVKSTEFNGQKVLTADFGNLSLQAGFGANGGVRDTLGGAVGTGMFGAARSYAAGASFYSVASGDFNGDGMLDLAGVNPFGLKSVMLGLGDGAFSTQGILATGSGPFSITTADFNNDGVLDLATANYYSNNASVLLGVGDGSFSLQVSYATGGRPEFISYGDFNGDGTLDLVTANSFEDTLSVLLGTGDGSFASQITYSAKNGLSIVDTGDFNNDGVLDLVTANSFDDSVSILLGLGDGSFSSQATYAVGNASTSVTTGDFNRDGAIDLAVSNLDDDSASVLLGVGDGTFAALVSFGTGSDPISVTTGDFNDDGVLDLVTANSGDDSASVLLGVGDGTFAAQVSYDTGNSPRYVATADLNNDGVLDLVAGTNVLLAQTTTGTAPLLDFSFSTLSDARQALPVLQRKLSQLSTQRGQIGAFLSRVEVANQVTQTVADNSLAAESRIRDADMATETANLTRLQILQNATTAVLSQANQQPALVLKLLEL